MTEENVLIVSPGGETRDNLALLCGAYGFTSVSVSDGKDTRATIAKMKYDIVLLNTPLENEFGLELAKFIAENTSASVILMAAQKNCDEIDRKIGNIGVYVLSKPLNRAAVIQAIRFVRASHMQIASLQEQNQKLETKLHNIKQIDRAKCVLIQYLRITEEDAHHQIQKRAMDQRIPEIEVAMDILRTYEM